MGRAKKIDPNNILNGGSIHLSHCIKIKGMLKHVRIIEGSNFSATQWNCWKERWRGESDKRRWLGSTNLFSSQRDQPLIMHKKTDEKKTGRERDFAYGFFYRFGEGLWYLMLDTPNSYFRLVIVFFSYSIYFLSLFF